MEPNYTPENTSPAYQLNWSLAIFGREKLPAPPDWLAALRIVCEADGTRILECNQRSENTLQFLISTRPEVPPADAIRSVKGRLQHLLRDRHPKAFRRNYHIQSVGNANAQILGRYVDRQPTKHPMADPRVQSAIESLQFHDGRVDLSQVFQSSHGQMVHSLQIVLENTEGWHEVRAARLSKVRDVIVRSARKKDWRLSRIGLLSNHLHVLLGSSVGESPQSISLSLMNNIVWVNGMKPILKFSYYVGTFSGYDRGVIRRH